MAIAVARAGAIRGILHYLVERQMRDPGLAHLLAVAAAHAEVEQRERGARQRAAGMDLLAEVGEHLRQPDAALVEDRAHAVALPAVDAVERVGARRHLQCVVARRALPVGLDRLAAPEGRPPEAR